MTWNGQFVYDTLQMNIESDEEYCKKIIGLALRKNKKRAHLIVSKILGKHYPQKPSIINYSAYLLAQKIRQIIKQENNITDDDIKRSLLDLMNNDNKIFYEPYRDVSDVTVFGYAETATCLGSLVARYLFANYLHSTRYPKNGIDYGDFNEEHSHNTQHHIVVKNTEILDDPSKTIVLVDDEITTGNTVLNTMKLFEKKQHHNNYIVATLTDTRKEEHYQKFQNFEKEYHTNVDVVALLRTSLIVADNAVDIAEPIIEDFKKEREDNYMKNNKGFIYKTIIEADIPNLSSGIDNNDLSSFIKNITGAFDNLVVPHDGRTLVLGVEEDMFVPSLIAEVLEKKGYDVDFSSTTLSPVITHDDDDYIIQDRIKYNVTHDDITRYAYNIKNDYKNIIVMTHGAEESHSLRYLFDKLSYRAHNIIIVEVRRPIILHEPLYGPEFGSYDADDVAWLLKDLSNVSLEAPVEEREESIQNGNAHYAESLPIEYVPSDEYKQLFFKALNNNSEKVAKAVAEVSEKVYRIRHESPVLVSLARAGTPVGILMKRYLEKFYHHQVPHYTISIVRGKGIDDNALRYIAQHHDVNNVIFVDGWTGKGAITKELDKALMNFEIATGICFPTDLAVLADPGSCVNIYGTREDYLIPSACLNSTVSGLVSRTVLRNDLIEYNDYHGAKYYQNFSQDDVSELFINTISNLFTDDLHHKYVNNTIVDDEPTWDGWEKVKEISEQYGINNINLVKPGVGETTRVLLRRIPWKILMRKNDKEYLQHIVLLAKQRGVDIEEVDDLPYACIGLIHPKYNQDATGEDGKKINE